MQMSTYTGTITIAPCNTWTISYIYTTPAAAASSRNAAVNLDNSSAVNDLYVQTTLNTVTAPCYTSALFSGPPIPYVYVNQPVTYNYGIISSADSLYYTLTTALTKGAIPCVYSFGYTASNPIPGLTLNPANGTINFTPTISGNFVVVVKVEEYNTAGQLIGTVMRDMEFVVINKNNKVPDANSGTITTLNAAAKKTGPYSIELCGGACFDFKANYTDPDAGDTVKFSDSNIFSALPNGGMNASIIPLPGANPKTLRLQYCAGTTVAEENYSFTVAMEDNACPLVGKQVYAYNLRILPGYTGPDIIPPGTSYCLNSPVVDLQVSPANAIGTWSGPGITNSTLGIFNPAVAGVGSHWIKFNSNNYCSTKKVDSVKIVVFNAPNVTITPVATQCISSPAFNLSAPTPTGTWIGNGITDGNLGTFNPSVAGIGSHIIKYSINAPCYAEDTVTINVVSQFNTTITPVGPFCVSAPTVQLKAATAGGTWGGPGVNASTGVFSPTTAGVGNHQITYTIAGACGSTSTTTISVIGSPAVTFSSDAVNGCEPSTINFSSIVNPQGGTYLWNFGDGVTTNDPNPSHTYNVAGVYTVSLTYDIVSLGCDSTLTKPNFVTIYAQPHAKFTADPQPTDILNTLIHFTDGSSGSPDNWNWQFGSLGNSTDQNPSFKFPDDTAQSYSVSLRVANNFGCTDSTEGTIVINPLVVFFAPNSFTPDKNKLNDIFLGAGEGIKPNSFDMQIFDRWGRKVFSSDNILVGWDGNTPEGEAPEGIYVWKVNFKDIYNKSHQFIGKVTMVR